MVASVPGLRHIQPQGLFASARACAIASSATMLTKPNHHGNASRRISSKDDARFVLREHAQHISFPISPGSAQPVDETSLIAVSKTMKPMP